MKVAKKLRREQLKNRGVADPGCKPTAAPESPSIEAADVGARLPASADLLRDEEKAWVAYHEHKKHCSECMTLFRIGLRDCEFATDLREYLTRRAQEVRLYVQGEG